MNRRVLFVNTLFASLIGAVLAIYLYTEFGPAPGPEPTMPPPVIQTSQPLQQWLADSNFIVPEGLNFVVAAEQATPAVVHIRATFAGVNSNGEPSYDLFRDFFDDNNRNYRPQPNQATGSGVIISADGYIITNHHVVEDARNIEVTLWTDQRFEAELIGTDPTTDLALIKVQGEGYPHLSFGNSDAVRIGEWVLAVGNPFDLTSTVTAGIVSAKARNINILGGGATIESFIQTDAAVNPGNSGGALVNLRGELVGVNTAIASRTGSYVGYSFAVPANLAAKVAEDLKNYGEVQRALLGVNIVNVSDLVNADLGTANGVYISAVGIGSSAQEAGLQEGDVIVQIDGRAVKSVAELQELVGRNRPGDEVSVTYIRGHEEYTTTAVLKNMMGTTQVVRNTRQYNMGGAQFENVDRREAEELGVAGAVRVTRIEGGIWEEAGMEEGFVITYIGKDEIRDVNDLETVLETVVGERIIVLGYDAEGNQAYHEMDF